MTTEIMMLEQDRYERDRQAADQADQEDSEKEQKTCQACHHYVLIKEYGYPHDEITGDTSPHQTRVGQRYECLIKWWDECQGLFFEERKGEERCFVEVP